MEIKIKVAPFVKKFLLHKSRGLVLNPKNIYTMIFFAQYKYISSSDRKNREIKGRYNLCEEMAIKTSLANWIRQRFKKEVTANCNLSFHFVMRELFYQDFFEYVNLRLLESKISSNDMTINRIIESYMTDRNLTDEDIKLETLARNYRRYRAESDIDINALIQKHLKDE